MNKAVFLDRDGTINFDYSHVFDPNRVSILKNVANAIADLSKNGFKIIILTNQSCIGRGLASLAQVIATNEKVCYLLKSEDPLAIIDKVLFSPDTSEKPTNRRKPNPGMIEEARAEFNLDLSKCWMVGDKLSDPLTGINAGLPKNQCILVSVNQSGEHIPSDEFTKCNDLSEVTRMILSKP